MTELCILDFYYNIYLDHQLQLSLQFPQEKSFLTKKLILPPSLLVLVPFFSLLIERNHEEERFPLECFQRR